MKVRILSFIILLFLFIGCETDNPTTNDFINGVWEGKQVQIKNTDTCFFYAQMIGENNEIFGEAEFKGNKLVNTGINEFINISYKRSGQIKGNIKDNKIEFSFDNVNKSIKYDFIGIIDTNNKSISGDFFILDKNYLNDKDTTLRYSVRIIKK